MKLLRSKRRRIVQNQNPYMKQSWNLQSPNFVVSKMKTKEDRLTDEEKRALRGSKFAPLASSGSQQRSRLAHPGGALTTNKAAALAKFMQRKLLDPHGLASINPHLLELAVQNAKQTLRSGGAGTNIKHVDSFDDDPSEEQNVETLEPKKKKNNKEKKKRKKHKQQVKNRECTVVEKPKKKLKL